MLSIARSGPIRSRDDIQKGSVEKQPRSLSLAAMPRFLNTSGWKLCLKAIALFNLACLS